MLGHSWLLSVACKTLSPQHHIKAKNQTRECAWQKNILWPKIQSVGLKEEFRETLLCLCGMPQCHVVCLLSQTPDIRAKRGAAPDLYPHARAKEFKEEERSRSPLNYRKNEQCMR